MATIHNNKTLEVFLDVIKKIRKTIEIKKKDGSIFNGNVFFLKRKLKQNQEL